MKYKYESKPASPAEIMDNAARLKPIVEAYGYELVGVNKHYPWHCACKVPDRFDIQSCDVWGSKVIRRGAMGVGYADPWEGASNLIKLDSISVSDGQIDLFEVIDGDEVYHARTV